LIPYRDQVYEELKSQHDENNLFEDPYFPANSKSLYHKNMPPQGVTWARPREMRSDAEFVVDGYERCDMDQGYVGNCWFIAGCVGIMQSPALFAKVVPQDQSFDDGYAGLISKLIIEKTFNF
jgi:hypothetical protein